MKKLLSLTLASLLAISMLAGCAQTPTDDSASSTGGSNSPSEASSEDLSQDTGNTMTFVNGEKELPTKFDNFAVFDYSLIDQFVSLGAVPKYGSFLVQNEKGSVDIAYGWERVFENHDLSGSVPMSTRSETYLEELLVANPDFIVITESQERFLDKYEAIAPTYIFPSVFEISEGSSIWKEEFKFVAQFLGETAQSEEMLNTFDELVASSREKVGAEIDGKTALVMQLNEKGFKLRMPDQYPAVYADMGFIAPENLNEDYSSQDYRNESGSFPVETIAEFNPDFIFIQVQSEETYNSIKDTPFWKSVTAVQEDRVYGITQTGWNHLNGYTANTMKINDIVYFITENKQIIPNLPLE